MNSRGVVEVVAALTGLRLGVLKTTTYTIAVLVALVTSIMAPPALRRPMSRITQTDEKLLRKIDRLSEHFAGAAVAADIAPKAGSPPRRPGRQEPQPAAHRAGVSTIIRLCHLRHRRPVGSSGSMLKRRSRNLRSLRLKVSASGT